METTKEQDAIIKFAKKFDEEMQIKNEEKEAQKQEEGGVEEKYEMKFLGISIRDVPENVKLIYILLFAILVVGALWYGISQLDKTSEKQGNKRRKSPKKDASAKKDTKKEWFLFITYFYNLYFKHLSTYSTFNITKKYFLLL